MMSTLLTIVFLVGLGFIGLVLFRIFMSKKPAADSLKIPVTTPKIPELRTPQTRKCDSFTDPGVTYTVDLSTITCSCPDHTRKINHHPPRAVIGLCKHLRKLLYQYHRMEMDPAITEAINDEYIAAATWLHHETIKGYTVLFAGAGQRGWINIYAPEREKLSKKSTRLPYRRYGYSNQESRWAYNERPPCASALLPTLQRLNAIA